MSIRVEINPSYKWEEEVRDKGISHRELEAIALLAQGFDNEDIADILRIKYQSVKNHMYHLTKKLGAKNSTHALLLAVGKNMIKVENPELAQKPEGKPSTKEIFWEILDKLAGTEDTELTKKIKKWMIRHGIDVDI